MRARRSTGGFLHETTTGHTCIIPPVSFFSLLPASAYSEHGPPEKFGWTSCLLRALDGPARLGHGDANVYSPSPGWELDSAFGTW